MRYIFRGLTRETGEPVEGNVTAPNEDVAYDVLGDRGIVVESLRQASAPARGDAATTAKAAQARVVQGVLHRLSDLPVDFDQLTSRYQGKRVWVLDRNKICKCVMIAQELENMSQDRGSPGSERSAPSVALEAQVSRLATIVEKMQKTMASMSMAMWRGGRGEGRRAVRGSTRDRTRDGVLVEVFEHTLSLMRRLEDPA